MSPPLPSDPEIVKRQARDLLHGLRRQNPIALQRYYAFDWLADIVEPTLADAQYTIAREYGYHSWQELMASLYAALHSKSATATFGA